MKIHINLVFHPLVYCNYFELVQEKQLETPLKKIRSIQSSGGNEITVKKVAVKTQIVKNNMKYGDMTLLGMKVNI